jgi:transposase
MRRRKRSYRSVKVNKLDLEKLGKQVEGKRVIFGIDAAKEKILGQFMDEAREKLVTVRWELTEQTRDIVKVLKELPAKQVDVVMEPTGTYGDPIRYQINEAGMDVYRVNPKRTHDAAEVWDGVPSMHDPKAAEIVARLHLDGVTELWEEPSEERRQLKASVDMMASYDKAITQKINEFEGKVSKHWPELTKKLKMTTATFAALMAEMGGPRAVRENPEAAAALMCRVGGSFLDDKKIAWVIESAHRTIGVPMVSEEEEMLKKWGKELQELRGDENEARRKMERQVLGNEESRRVGEVVGKGTAAVLTAYLGNLSDYASASSLEKALGLNLKVRSSGKQKGVLKITKRGPSLPRRFLFLAVLRMIQYDKVMAAWYQLKVQRDGGLKIKAIIALMRKLAKALWHVARGKSFDSSKLFDVNHMRYAEEA